MAKVDFFWESMRDLKTVGTFTRSSGFLSKKMIKPVDFNKAKVLIELGAGDGAITKHILSKMSPDAKLFAFEVNEAFCRKLESLNDPRLVVLQEDVTNLKDIMKRYGHDKVDYIISAIPFVAFSKEDTIHIVNQAKDLLASTGKYIQVHYSTVLKKIYKGIFATVDLNFVLVNMPPAWVFVCH
ncbi:MAG: methyltransferase domain-containing protein [Saprospiraceae bacterium]|nr:methyltransferase domain-containing protein [Saprospiraceae bacterium]